MRIPPTAVPLVVVAACLLGSAPAAGQPAAEAGTEAHQTLLKRYCVGCHNERLLAGGLALDTVDVGNVGGSPDVWEKVAQKLRTRTMPPAGRPRPDGATYDALANHLESALDDAWTARPNPGRPAVQRLNRSEYSNAIRDLLALEVDGRTLLPADESGYGFDNRRRRRYRPCCWSATFWPRRRSAAGRSATRRCRRPPRCTRPRRAGGGRADEETPCAGEILRSLARQAYRPGRRTGC